MWKHIIYETNKIFMWTADYFIRPWCNITCLCLLFKRFLLRTRNQRAIFRYTSLMQQKLTLSTTALFCFDIDFVNIIAVTHTFMHSYTDIWNRFNKFVYSYKLASNKSYRYSHPTVIISKSRSQFLKQSFFGVVHVGNTE